VTPEEREARRQTDLVATGVVVVATLWYALALGWCIRARVGNGHDALTAARGIMADNMIHWGIWGPVRGYTIAAPGSDYYYANHPFGTYWLVSLFARVLGRHEFVPRFAPVLQSIAIPPLLYAICRRYWDPVCGALAALAYVALPITLAFGNLAGFEVPTLFACLLTTWGYLRFSEQWKTRWMLVSLLGVLWGVNVDWNYLMFVGPAVGVLVVAALVLPPRWFAERVRVLPFARWALFATAITAIGVAAWFWYFHKIHAVATLLASDDSRSKGAELPLETALSARRYWVDATFTPLAVTLGKVAFPILLLRVFVMRRIREIFVVAIWIMAFVTYTKFKYGADVHIYWPFAFGAYFALSFGMLAWVVMGLARWILAWFRRADTKGAIPLLTLGAMSIVPIAILPDGIEGLRYARQTGGRFNENGARDFRDVDKAQALEWMAERMAPDIVVEMHNGMHSTWADDWALHRAIKTHPTPPDTEAPALERYFVADLEFQPSGDQKKMFDAFEVKVVDHFAMVDRSAPKGPLDAYVFDERQPTFLEWYLAYGTEPVRTIRPDPWATWELRDAWSQTPNPPPTGTPETLEQLRIAHNVAVAKGDAAAADDYQEQLVSRIDISVATVFTDGTHLLGERYTTGVLPELVLFFRPAATPAEDLEFAISSVVEEKKARSLVAPDDKTKQLGAPFYVPTKYWKVGYIYAEKTDIHHRSGRERFAGRWEPQDKAPKPLQGGGEVQLLTIP
jgi:hypothetical protein